jgi:hypothetical protein
MGLSIEERYLRLGLEVGRHVGRMVDAYFGPRGLAAEVEAASPVDPAALADTADELRDEVDNGWLSDQIVGLRTYAGVLAGELIGFAAEAEGCYGVRPTLIDEAVFVAAHERLDGLLEGRGSLSERYRRWETKTVVPGAKLERTLTAAIETARRLTGEIVELPVGEGLVVGTATGVPWMAFCKYLGNLQSRISVNIDRPLSALEVLTLAIHETYPGHHTERCCKEQRLVRDKDLLEETIVLVPTPQSLLAEGIARIAPTLLLEGESGHAFEAVIRDAGVDFDLVHALAVRREREPCSWAVVNAGLMLDETEASDAEVRGYLERWALLSPEIAGRLVTYMKDPTSRTYVVTYLAGEELCEAYVANDPAHLPRLLSEQVRVSELTSASQASVQPDLRA